LYINVNIYPGITGGKWLNFPLKIYKVSNFVNLMKRRVDCLVGLQYGSEGKGKVAAYLSGEYTCMVRSGGAQAGHTYYDEDGNKHVNRQLPCSRNPSCLLYLPGNSVVTEEVLIQEIINHKIYPNRLMIDNHAMVVTGEHREIEAREGMREKIGSTLEGIGAAQADKIMRRGKLFDYYAQEDPELYFYCNDTARSLNNQIEMGHWILCEGTQGFRISLSHGEYPFLTSRDVTASALLADSGISPDNHAQTIGVMRTYPIRVGGNSGPGGKEISWEEITKRSCSRKKIEEYTTVTKRLRRVFEQDFELLEQATRVNKPRMIALMFIDYIDARDYGKSEYDELSVKSRDYIKMVEDKLRTRVSLIGTGEKREHIIDLREQKEKRESVQLPCCLEELYDECWPTTFYGYDWDSGAVEDFLDRKLDWKRKIFIFNAQNEPA
jgi:adenylosuccinate synthase